MPDEEKKDFHELDIPRNPDEEGTVNCNLCGLPYPKNIMVVKQYNFRPKEYLCPNCNQILSNQGM